MSFMLRGELAWDMIPHQASSLRQARLLSSLRKKKKKRKRKQESWKKSLPALRGRLLINLYICPSA